MKEWEFWWTLHRSNRLSNKTYYDRIPAPKATKRKSV